MKSKRLLLMLLVALLAPWAAMAQSQLNEGFESTTFPPEDWTTIHVSGSNYWARYTSYKHSGDASAYAHWASSGHENYMITPKLAPAAGESLSFYVSAQSYSGTTLYVKVSTTTAEASAFSTTLATYTTGSSGTIGTTSPSTWVEKTIDLSSYVGQQIFIAFHVVDNNGGDVIIDDVTGVTLHVASCVKPTGLAVEDGVATWDAGTASQWNLQYKKVSDATWTSVTGLTAASYTFSGLDDATSYEVQVQANCGGGDLSDWTNSVTFDNCTAITTFPWTEDFESYSTGDFSAPCWVNEHISGNGTKIFGVSTSNAHGTSTKQLNLPDQSNGTMTKLALPEMTLTTGDEYTFSIDVYRNTSGNSYTSEGVRVYASTDGEIEGATELGFLYRNCEQTDGGVVTAETNTGWYTYEFAIPFTGTCYIVLRGENQYGSATYLDNFKVKKELPCVKPSNPTFVSSTTTSATLSWTNGADTQTAWQIAYSTDPNFDPDEMTPVDVTTNPGTISGLTHSTIYYAYVRANCGSLGYSDWSVTYCQFATACDAITSFPWSEDFNSYSTTASSTTAPSSYPNDVMPGCWTFLNRSESSSSYPQVFLSSYSDYAVSGNCLFFKSSSTTPLYAVLPEFGTDIAGLEISFTYRNEGTGTSNGTLYVGYMTDPNDASTFNTENAVTCTQTTNKTPMNVVLPNAPAGSYFAFKYQGGSNNNYYLAIDNITVKVPVFVTANQIVNTVSDPATEMTWNEFVSHWNNGDSFTNTTFTLMENITITEMVGTEENPFTGIFEGNNKTITADITSGEKAAAPFHYIKDATIKNLTMTGTVTETATTSDGYHAGGLVGYAWSGTNTILNCRVSTDVTITTYGGGIIGHAKASTINMTGCLYDGNITNTTATTDGNSGVGGLIGWCDNGATLNLNSCVFNGTYGGDGASVLFHPVVCGTGNVNTSVGSRSTFTNVYYTLDQQGTDSGAVNVISDCGKHAYTITAETGITATMSGEYTEYDMSGIKAYASNYGLLYNNGIIAGDGDQVVLTLRGSTTGDYQADPGTLTANGETYTLAMTANDTEISESCNAPTNLRVPAQSINAHGASIAWDNPDGKLFEYCLTVGPDYTQTSWQETTDPGMQYAIYLENPLVQNTDYRFYLRKKCGENYYSAEVYVDFHTIAGNKAPTSLAYADVDAHTATITWSGVSTNYYHQSYDLYYSTDETMPQTPVQDNLIGGITTTSQGLTGLNGQTTYYVWVRDNCGDDGYSTWAGPISFTTAISCPAPTQFAASDVTNHTATLSWQGTSDSYTVRYRIPASIDSPVINEKFEGTTLPDGWTHLGNGTAAPESVSSTHTYDGKPLKFSGATTDNVVVLPVIEGVNTLVIDFWSKAEGSSSGNFDLGYVTDATDASTFETLKTYTRSEHASYTHVRNYSLASVPEGARIAFRHRSGLSNWYWFIDDVVIGSPVPAGPDQFVNNIDGETVTLSGLLAETEYEAWLQGDCGEVDGQSTIVSTTFTTDLPCPDPTNLQVVENSLKSDRVTLSWDSDYAEAWTVAFKAEGDADFSEQTVSENPYTLQGLTEETTYTVKVRSNCGSADGLSTGWSNEVTFTTTEACVVMDVAVNDVTHHAATVTWTGDNKDEDNPGFTVSYRTAQQIDGVEESFNTTSIPDGWTKYSGLLSNVMAGTSTLATTTSGWAFNTKNTVFDCHTYLNIWSTSTNYWLVTPRTELANGAACSFDLALTIWSSLTAVTAGSQTDDKFVVLISTDNKETWTILRQWDNAGSEYVYDNIACSATGENVTIDLSSYAGQNVYLAFYGESTVSGGDNALHIDNVTIGTPVAEGTWQTMTAANDANSANLSGLTAGTKYDVKVAPNCDATLESDVLQFTTVSPNEKWFITEGNWGTASNWEPAGAPTINQNVTLMANATIESTCVAEAKSINGTGTGTDAYTLTIKDGGKLKHLNSNVRATVEKEIRPYSTNYDADTYNNGDYYLIANPLTSTVTPSEANGFFAGNYDLYSWDYAQDLEWRNYEASNFSLSSGAYGYLYANEAGATLTYTGTINAYTSNKSRYCSVASNPDNYDFPGWYLLGNPYLYDAYLANASSNGTALPYIKMNTAGDGFENVAAGTPIEPMEGFFYQQATSTGSVYVVTSAPAVQSNAKLNMNLRRNNKQLDNAILVFGGDQQLGKMTFRPNSSKVYMPKEGKDYAIVSTESNMGTMPVNFKAEENGTYTLSFTNEEVTFSYLHLIDNMTGEDVDLLAGASTGSATYTFDARTTDYESRFKLVFATGNNANDDAFAFYSNGSFIINNEGEATLQVIDMNGRILKSESINGCANVNVKAAAGVYMLRLVNGNDVKVQKVVVR